MVRTAASAKRMLTTIEARNSRTFFSFRALPWDGKAT
jgi:hypothetical protein